MCVCLVKLSVKFSSLLIALLNFRTASKVRGGGIPDLRTFLFDQAGKVYVRTFNAKLHISGIAQLSVMTLRTLLDLFFDLPIGLYTSFMLREQVSQSMRFYLVTSLR